MTPIHPHDYIQNYEAGVAALKDRPNDRQLQHQIVLALARAGALTFAISEYDRFGLSAVTDDEDIMALNGRLSKDLYLRSSGQVHAAIDFDPLNYAAHASTLKQFMMIATKRGDDLGWLSEFRPPRPLHYAGHIRLNLTESEEADMRITISDALQQKDVGFGFGALAAGGDILFAEALLEQGAELHLVLPCEPDLFKRESVMPFGEEWEHGQSDFKRTVLERRASANTYSERNGQPVLHSHPCTRLGR